MAKQTRVTSLIESASSTVVGFLVAVGLQIIVLPWFGVVLSVFENLQIAVIFMGVGALRGYIFRRTFEWLRVSGLLP